MYSVPREWLSTEFNLGGPGLGQKQIQETYLM